MVVLLMEHVPPKMRGELSRWMIEPRAGVFVGNVSAMVREKLWEHVIEQQKECGLMMLYTAQVEQGFAVRTHGDTTRQVVDMEGISLIKRIVTKRPPTNNQQEADTPF